MHGPREHNHVPLISKPDLASREIHAKSQADKLWLQSRDAVDKLNLKQSLTDIGDDSNEGMLFEAIEA